jgi:Sulfotransferase family
VGWNHLFTCPAVASSADSEHTARLGGTVPDGPVFVLTGGRSGSTLLRLILDSHPDLACPPETGVGGVCVGVARVLGVLEGARQQPGGLGEGPVGAGAGEVIRRVVDAGFGDYLARRGRRRWCDKSLGNVFSAGLLAQLWPEAQFVCLTRHCMDVIASVLEVCQWGLSGFGLERFGARYPGNSVAAAGAWWLASVQAMLRFESSCLGRCLRVRYEDLVAAPEQVAAGIFAFLGARQVPGITQACFGAGHAEHGPGDHKVWFTSGVCAASVGRGVTVPAGLLPLGLRASINEALGVLGYRLITDDWHRAGLPEDPRAGTCVGGRAGVGGGLAGGGGDWPPSRAGVAVLDEVSAVLAVRAAGVGGDTLAGVGGRWPGLAGAGFRVVAYAAGGQAREFCWRVPATVTQPPPGEAGQAAPGHVITFIAEAGTWLALLGGRANVAGEILAGRLRCPGLAALRQGDSPEAQALAELLGITHIRPQPGAQRKENTMKELIQSLLRRAARPLRGVRHTTGRPASGPPQHRSADAVADDPYGLAGVTGDDPSGEQSHPSLSRYGVPAGPGGDDTGR